MFINEFDFETEIDKASNIAKVRGMYAQFLFTVEKKYNEAITILESLNASPFDVLELFPDIQQIEQTDNAMESIEIDKNYRSDPIAVEVLVQYLKRERLRILKYRNSDHSAHPESEIITTDATPRTIICSDIETAGHARFSDTVHLLKFVDTTLICAYIYLNYRKDLLDQLKSANNYSNFNFTEKLLTSRKMVLELTQFYKSRDLHQKALELIFKSNECVNGNFTPKGMATVVAYLQEVKPNDEKSLTLIFSFAKPCFLVTYMCSNVFL